MEPPRARRRLGSSARLAFVAWSALVVASPARADRLTDAEELFRRAKALMADNRYPEACPLLEESEKLDPQMGTLLNLAICHENVGRIASAWGEFRAVEQQARAANREDRVKLAAERAAKLEPRLSRIKIVAPPEAKAEGLTVRIDGEVKGEPLWPGVAVDPGTRTVEASAPGKKTAVIKVNVEGEGTIVGVTLPRLEPDPEGSAAAPRADPDGQSRSRRTTGLVVGGAGIAAIAAGGVFGALAIASDSDAVGACPQPCYIGSDAARRSNEDTDRALLFANVSNVVLPIGIVAAAIGAYLFLTAGPTRKPAAGAAARALPVARW